MGSRKATGFHIIILKYLMITESVARRLAAGQTPETALMLSLLSGGSSSQ